KTSFVSSSRRCSTGPGEGAPTRDPTSRLRPRRGNDDQRKGRKGRKDDRTQRPRRPQSRPLNKALRPPPSALSPQPSAVTCGLIVRHPSAARLARTRANIASSTYVPII